MMSPRSFLVTRQQQQRLRSSPTSPPISVSDSPSTSGPTPKVKTLPVSAPVSSPSPLPSPSPLASPLLSQSPATSPSLPARPWGKNERPTSQRPPAAVVNTTASACSASAVVSRRDQPPRGSSHNAMIADRFQNGVQASPTLFVDRRPTTPTSPVQIPFKAQLGHDTAHHHHHKPHHRYRGHDHDRRRHVHSSDSIPPSVAALLAVTSIPPPRGLRMLRQGRLDRLDEKRMTVDAIIDRAQGVEQQLSLSLSKSPLDVLLTPPDELDDDDDDEVSVSDSGLESVLSTRTVSLESMPSLSDSVATGTVSSLNSPCSPHRGAGCRARPKHRSLTPVSSPPGKRELHPLAFNTGSDSNSDDDVDELDFRVFHPLPDALAKTAAETRSPLQPLRSAFKSNLTASLRALRNAARSFSTLNLTSVPPEDFLTRSILTIDPHIPYTDERRPPPLEEEPSPALRRYLNPTSSARIDSRQPITPQALSPALASASLSPSPGTVALLSSVLGPNENATSDRPAFTASIQMHTYKVHRSRSLSAASASAAPPASTSTSPSRSSTAAGPSGSSARSLPATDERPFPGPRQRELRENSDFIRVAVMEMAMRRLGKLDDRRPGRARLALPPRKASTRPYVIGANGVPARWVGTTVDGLSW